MSDILYDVNYFISKFEQIPEEDWCTESYENNGAFCALGHCGVTGSISGNSEVEALDKLIPARTIVNINDGRIHKYSQETPKQRVLAALRDLK